MYDWNLESLIRTMLFLACFFTFVGVLKYICYTIYILIAKIKKHTIKQTPFLDEIYTVQSVCAFFIAFGWLGYFLLTSQKISFSIHYVIIISTILGIISMFMCSKIIYMEKKLIFEETEIKEIINENSDLLQE